MIEKCWNSCVRPLAKAVSAIQPRAWIVLVVAVVTSVRAVDRFILPYFDHREEIAEAFGSIGFIYGPPQADHSNSRVWYLRTSEKGLGLYTHELTEGKSTLLKEWETPSGFGLAGQRVLSLSPDDRFLPVVTSLNSFGGTLEICDADSGNELGQVRGLNWAVREIAWMTPESLVWLKAGAPAPRNVVEIHTIIRQADGTWSDRTAVPRLTNASCLTSLSSNTIAWMDAKGVYAMNLASNSIDTLFSAQGNEISRIDYSRKTGQFLLTCRDKSGFSLWRLELKADGPKKCLKFAGDQNIRSAQWVNDGAGYAYLNNETLVVKTDASEETDQLHKAFVDTMMAAPAGDGLFFVGLKGDQPGVGLWRYGARDQVLTNLVCYSDAPSSHATRVQPSHCVFKPKGGDPLSYYVYRPVNFKTNKKYPLLIGDTVFGMLAYQVDFDGPSWAEAMANCGAYVVIVDRKTWFLTNENEWGTNVMTIYDQVSRDPAIDKSKIFLYAASVETAYLSKFLNDKPAGWKGIILFNPVELPSVLAWNDTQRLPKMLISAGRQENRSEWYKQYQQEAYQKGLVVEIFEHPNASHVLTSIPALRGRIHAVNDFVFHD